MTPTPPDPTAEPSPGPDRAPDPAPDPNAAELRRLEVALRLSRDLRLMLAVYDRVPVRDAAMAHLRGCIVRDGATVVTVDLGTDPEDVFVLRRVMAALPNPTAEAEPRKTIVMLIGLEQLLAYGQGGTRETGTGVLGQLNFQRDAWPRRVPCPVVLWLPPMAAAALTEHAPDFNDWISYRFTFVSADPTARRQDLANTLQHLEHNLVRRLPAEQLRQRIGALREMAAELTAAGIDTDTDRRALADTQLQLAVAQFDLGQWQDAIDLLEGPVLAGYQQLEDPGAVAEVNRRLAEILFFRGAYNRALKLLRDEVLPVFEARGDARETAITQGHIADTLFRRGDVNQSLKIRKEAELPIYQAIDDKREIAISKAKIAEILFQRGDFDQALVLLKETLSLQKQIDDDRGTAITNGKIADMLEQRGDLDRALTIRTEEALPVYQAFGDTRSIAVTKGKIADVFFQRGNLDQALKIFTEEVLPPLEGLGDTRSLALTKLRIARIRLHRGDWDQGGAGQIHDELADAWDAVQELQAPDAVARVGALFGLVLVKGGDLSAALAVLEAAAAAADKIGRTDDAADLRAQIAQIRSETDT